MTCGAMPAWDIGSRRPYRRVLPLLAKPKCASSPRPELSRRLRRKRCGLVHRQVPDVLRDAGQRAPRGPLLQLRRRANQMHHTGCHRRPAAVGARVILALRAPRPSVQSVSTKVPDVTPRSSTRCLTADAQHAPGGCCPVRSNTPLFPPIGITRLAMSFAHGVYSPHRPHGSARTGDGRDLDFTTAHSTEVSRSVTRHVPPASEIAERHLNNHVRHSATCASSAMHAHPRGKHPLLHRTRVGLPAQPLPEQSRLRGLRPSGRGRPQRMECLDRGRPAFNLPHRLAHARGSGVKGICRLSD